MTPFDQQLLAQTLTLIEQVDPSAHGTECQDDAADRYAQRGTLIWAAVAIATRGGLNAGVAIDLADPQWPVVFIELPTGQVSWHMPGFDQPYDGHDGPTKSARILAYATRVRP
jgi:hypothetical protein